MTWFELLRQRRENLKLTQTELAVRAGVSLPSIQKMEAGKANPSLKTLEKVFDQLQVKIDFQIKDSKDVLTSAETVSASTEQKPVKSPSRLQEIGAEVTGLSRGSAIERAGKLVKIFEKLTESPKRN